MNQRSEFHLLHLECQSVVREAGRLLLGYFEQPFRIDFKGQFNMVTEADIASESFLIEKLTGIDPGINIFSEENLENQSATIRHFHEYDWVVDPLDGTTNFAHRVPHFCISVALVRSGLPVTGVVYNPCSGEMFTAIKGHGAFLNGTRCRVSPVQTIEHCLLVTGFPYKIRELQQTNLQEFCALRLRSQGVRRFGAAALDLAWVACGRFDGYWERWLKPWDTAAGVLLTEESGGRVTDFAGGTYSILMDEILASNGNIHQQFSKLLTYDWPHLPDFLSGPV